jgi:hypothetical protein
MVDPRIYRAGLALVAVAVIIFGFSFKSAPGGDTTTLAPGQFFAGAYTTMTKLAHAYPERVPGSAGDQDLAQKLRMRLRQIGGFKVSTDSFSARTATGNQELENVIASRSGLDSGSLVIVSQRDGTAEPAAAELSGTAVMLGLARALSGETLNRSVMLVSTSGSVGAAGARRLAASLTDGQADAVIVLGDLASATARNPIIVPWSSADVLAPPQLRTTLATYLAKEAGLHAGSTAVGGQLAQFAFPIAPTAQAPFNDRGIPAVTVSLSGERLAAAGAHLGSPRALAAIGNALLETVNALAPAPAVPAPSNYLQISGKVVPAWAARLLVLALILPVAAATLDALARARRRRHSVMRWIGWVLAGAVPFVLGLVLLLIVGHAGILSAAPRGAVAGGVSATGGDVATLLVVTALVVVAFFILRPLCLRMLAGMGGDERRPEGAPADAAGVALSLVMCSLTLIVWLLNPFAALLLVPALHLWLWLAQPGVRAHRVAVVLLMLLALVPAGLVVYYYWQALGLSLGGLIWDGALLVAGGGMSLVAALYWSLALGCLASAWVLGLRALRTSTQASEPPVTVRGPSTYAGPGSLGGTKSALRR